MVDKGSGEPRLTLRRGRKLRQPWISLAAINIRRRWLVGRRFERLIRLGDEALAARGLQRRGPGRTDGSNGRD